jgi:thiosulfate dehydrogenase (quinone) large subunit
LRKLFSGQFSAASMLSHSSGPFAQFFSDMVANPVILSMVNVLVITGEIAIGLMLMLGLLVRLASYLGIIMMLLYYLPLLPPANGWIAQQIVYILVFVVLIVAGSGYFFGLDALAAKFESRRSWLRFLLG